MICPECENGKVFHPLAHVKASKDFGKFKQCHRCKGSGIAHSSIGKDVITERNNLFVGRARVT